MSSIGSYLRELRAARGTSLEDLARSTRINRRYLEALEAEQFQDLPAPVFTKGFIRAYCQMLEEAPDEALRRYGEQTGQPAGGAYTVPAGRMLERGPRTRGPGIVSVALLVALGGALVILTWVLRDGSDSRTGTGGAPTVESPGPPRGASTAVGTTAASPSPGAPPVEPSTRSTEVTRSVATPSPVAAPGVAAPYRLVARATAKTWVRVQTENGQTIAEEVIPAGEVREWSSNRRFVLTVGNAGGVTLELNGQLLPPLGFSGAVVRGVVIPPARP